MNRSLDSRAIRLLSDGLESRAEVAKLARLLGREQEQLAYLEAVPAADLRLLRERTTDMLFDSQDRTFARLAAASRLLPVGLTAVIAQRAFGPVLSARLAGRLEPGRAAEVAAKLPTGFLAEIAVNLDPRRADQVIARIRPDRVAQITHELVRRGEYVTMGRFVGHLPGGAIDAALGSMDDSSLLQVAFVLEDKSSLASLVELLPQQRLEGIVDAAVDESLWLQALDLVSRVGEQQRATFVSVAAARHDRWLDSLLEVAVEYALWDQLLAIVLPLDAGLKECLAEGVASLDRAHRSELAERAREAGVLDKLGPLGGVLVG